MTTEPVAYGLLRSAEHSAAHMEMRDVYTPHDPDWLNWQAGRRFDPEERWASWSDLIRATVARGVTLSAISPPAPPAKEIVSTGTPTSAISPKMGRRLGEGGAAGTVTTGTLSPCS